MTLTITQLEAIAKNIAAAWMTTNKKLLDSGRDGFALDQNIDRLITFAFMDDSLKAFAPDAEDREVLEEKVLEYAGVLLREMRSQVPEVEMTDYLLTYVVENTPVLEQKEHGAVLLNKQWYSADGCEAARIAYYGLVRDHVTQNQRLFAELHARITTPGYAVTPDDMRHLKNLEDIIRLFEHEEKAAAGFAFN